MDYLQLLGVNKAASNRIEDNNERCGLNQNLGFNIFTSFSETFRKENYHSQILRNIIDPSKNGLQCKSVLSNLCDHCSAKLNIGKYQFHKNVNVEIEKDNIDILIHDEKKAIIIENKINNAIDQRNQLARYYEIVENMKLEVYAIIYIPKHEGHVPNTNAYSGKYKYYKKKVLDKLVVLPAISGEGRDSLLRNILAPSISMEKDNILGKLYIQQYFNLVEHIGGEILNERNYLDIIKNIYSNKENQSIANNIVEAWNNKEKYIGIAIQESIMERDKDYSQHEYGETIYKEIDDFISVAYNQDQSIGYIYTPGKEAISVSKRRELKKILEKKEYDQFSREPEFDGSWYWRYLEIENNQLSLEQWEDVVYKRLLNLENDYLYREKSK